MSSSSAIAPEPAGRGGDGPAPLTAASAAAPAPVFVRWTWQRIVLVAALAYAAYAAARWTGGTDEVAAHANALGLVDLERTLGLGFEGSVQTALDVPALVFVLNHVYLAAQFVVTPAALVWVTRRSRTAGARLWETLVVGWILATPVAALLPVAPPRLAGTGIADTITLSGSHTLTSPIAQLFYNPLAAVPSMHAAFAFAVAAALASTARTPVGRVLGAAWAPLIAVTVVATGNHYVLDVVAGLAVTLVAWLIVWGAPRLVARAGGAIRAARAPSLPAVPAPARASARAGFCSSRQS
ncbi:phosphatase PAP2 family protein [Patulibacter sp. SYSU D01012]|uniref:phosphatase PAP2 family protein n=1 Tax=Patulibacter sp. SYSU D01012 TaxID=2817381 RepID=UPI001B317EB8|nr:phosphatase PAP2 family protein [Patulibacter sp. SYSU D01012]